MSESEQVQVETLDEWLVACAERTISAAAIREVREIRPVAEGTGITVGRVHRVTLVGYRAGRLVRVLLEPPPEGLRTRLTGLGFAVKHRVDNLG